MLTRCNWLSAAGSKISVDHNITSLGWVNIGQVISWHGQTILLKSNAIKQDVAVFCGWLKTSRAFRLLISLANAPIPPTDPGLLAWFRRQADFEQVLLSTNFSSSRTARIPLYQRNSLHRLVSHRTLVLRSSGAYVKIHFCSHLVIFCPESVCSLLRSHEWYKRPCSLLSRSKSWEKRRSGNLVVMNSDAAFSNTWAPPEETLTIISSTDLSRNGITHKTRGKRPLHWLLNCSIS